MNICTVRTLTQKLTMGYTSAGLLERCPLPHEPELFDGSLSVLIIHDPYAVSFCKHCATLYVDEKPAETPKVE